MKLERQTALLVGRVFVVLLFVMSGYDKLLHAARTADYMRAVGLPGAGLPLAAAAGLVELGAGLAILVGWRTRAVALVLAAYLVPVTWFTHLAVAQASADPVVRINETMQAMKNLAVIGACLLLHVAGPGAHAVDGK